MQAIQNSLMTSPRSHVERRRNELTRQFLRAAMEEQSSRVEGCLKGACLVLKEDAKVRLINLAFARCYFDEIVKRAKLISIWSP